MAKDEKKDELDTETTIADMNVEGFRWYDPSLKKNPKRQKILVTKKEYWAMVKGAFVALLPLLGCVVLACGIVFLLMYLWLG